MFLFLDGEFVLVHFTLQWSWGDGEQLSCGVAIEVVGTCVILGMDSRANTLIAHNRLNPTGKLKPSLVYLLSCVCFVVICGCYYECFWYSIGCGWMMNLAFWYERKQGRSHFLGNLSPFRNLVLLVICSLDDLLLLINIICSMWSCLNVNLDTVLNHNHDKKGKVEVQHCPQTTLRKLDECVWSRAFGCALCSLRLWVGGILLWEQDLCLWVPTKSTSHAWANYKESPWF